MDEENKKMKTHLKTLHTSRSTGLCSWRWEVATHKEIEAYDGTEP
jgi:hypothetical protein